MHFKKINFTFLFFFSSLPASYPEDFQIKYFESGFVGSIEDYAESLHDKTKEHFPDSAIAKRRKELDSSSSSKQKATNFPHSLFSINAIFESSLPPIFPTDQSDGSENFDLSLIAAAVLQTSDSSPSAPIRNAQTSPVLSSNPAPEKQPHSRFTVRTLLTPPLLAIIEEPEQSKKDNEKYLSILADVIMNPENEVYFGVLEAFFYSTKREDKRLRDSLLRRFNPFAIEGSNEDMTELDLYLRYALALGHTTLCVDIVKLLLEEGNVQPTTPYTNEKGVETCFIKDLKESPISNKAAILELVHSTKHHVLVRVPLDAGTSNLVLTPLFHAPRQSSNTHPAHNDQGSFHPITVSHVRSCPPPLEPTGNHFYTPLMPTTKDREYILANCRIHIEHSREMLTYEELGGLIRCVDGANQNDRRFLRKILKTHANVLEVDDFGKNHLWHLISHDGTPISLQILTILLKAGINPHRKHIGNESFMDYLQHPFRMLSPKGEREAYDCCCKYLKLHPLM